MNKRPDIPGIKITERDGVTRISLPGSTPDEETPPVGELIVDTSDTQLDEDELRHYRTNAAGCDGGTIG